TQQQLAEKIGKKREYIAMLEKGETDMQLSTFILISEAVGLKFALTY
ncbi:helix-turn-helix transcriptional regulator, partial [bacterium]|nr:helix-turn-helix transcriptional regulator [bacterium]